MPVITKSALLMVPVQAAYDVVVDVAAYPQFLPACRATQVISQPSDLELTASVTVGGSIGGRQIEETFVTQNQHQPGERVEMTLSQGPFERLQGHWSFTRLGNIGCKVEVTIDYVPRGLLARMLSKLAEPMANRLVDAFSDRIESQHALQQQS